MSYSIFQKSRIKIENKKVILKILDSAKNQNTGFSK